MLASNVIALFVAAGCALVPVCARAQAMNDPMRPPGAAASSSGAQTSASGGLQVVITSPQRKLAVIDGSVVPLGAAVRSGTLSGVSDSLAVLKKNGESDVLLMHPGIDKKRRTP